MFQGLRYWSRPHRGAKRGAIFVLSSTSTKQRYREDEPCPKQFWRFLARFFMEGWMGWMDTVTAADFSKFRRDRLALLCMKLRATQITSSVIRYRGYVLDAGAGHVYLFWRGWWWQSSFPSLVDQDILPKWPKVDFSTTNQFLVYDSDSLNTLTLQGSSKYAFIFHSESEMIASTIGFHIFGLGWLKSQPEKFMIIDASQWSPDICGLVSLPFWLAMKHRLDPCIQP